MRLSNAFSRLPDHWTKIQIGAIAAILLVLGLLLIAAPDPNDTARCVDGVLKDSASPINREWVLVIMGITLLVSVIALVLATILAQIKSRDGCISAMLTGGFAFIFFFVLGISGPVLGGYFCPF